jgi:hypothetical protein
MTAKKAATKKATTKAPKKPKPPQPTGLEEVQALLRRRFKLHDLKGQCGAQMQALVEYEDSGSVKSISIGQWEESYYNRGGGSIANGVVFKSVAALRTAIETLTKLADAAEAK